MKAINAAVGSIFLAFALMGCQSASELHNPRDNLSSEPAPPGQLVDVGGYRLHAIRQGAGKPAVVFIAGSGDGSMHWSLVQPEVARFTRTVSFDRAGFAWSDPGPIPRTLRQEAYELRLLLAKLRVPPPYVLVGHSLGGLVARRFAEDHLDEVAGVVLVDATDPDTTLIFGRQENGKWVNRLVRVRENAKQRPVPPPQTMASGPPAPPTEQEREQFEQMKKMIGVPKIEPPFNRLPERAQADLLVAQANPKLQHQTEDYFAEELAEMFDRERRDSHPLRDLPLIVLTGRAEVGDPPAGISAQEWEIAMAEKKRQKEQMAKLSRNSRFVRDQRSGHHIHLDNPDLVIAAIRDVVVAARTGTPVAAATFRRTP